MDAMVRVAGVGVGATGGRSPETQGRAGTYHAGMASLPTVEQVQAALAAVQDPEIHRPITDLGMVKSVTVTPEGRVDVGVWLTVAGCPLRDTINRDVTAAV